MIKVYPDSSRFAGDRGWLRSRFSFSFGDYYDAANTEFGALRVFNDDIIQGGHGFGAHPHREMEIVSVVLKGQLKHEDSTGHTAVTSFGGVQRMSAGTGIIHSEVNPSDEECHLLQIWFTPGESKLSPSYETTSYDPAEMKNALLPIVSHRSSKHVAHIHQDLTMYLSRLEPGHSVRFQQPEGRRIYIFVIEGGLTLDGSVKLAGQDSARITEHPELVLESDAGAMFMLIDLP
ncbi:pirin family protein [Paenibacillus spongiae]|uniref:Pirin family protein n=1 Tax=Paenibacillus spongiae TaxID=2909671 RepID=A0ABY5SFH7_9BACL|nr:pirin-like bicupin family protein [Paenibacillus spongiae]UVI31465.1 pirin family protein [Paenibacillus spongiae]